MDWKTKLSLPFRILLLALRPVPHAEQWSGIMQLLVVFLTLLGLGGAGLAGLVMPNPLPKPAPNWPLIVAYPTLLGFVLIFIAACRLQRRLDVLQDKEPVIVFMRGAVAIGDLWRQTRVIAQDEEMDKTERVGESVYGIYVFIKNDPPGNRSEGRTARRAVGTIEAFERSDLSTWYASYFGRWRQNPQVITVPHHAGFEHLAELDLPPNGLPHRLDFALKHPKDDAIYGHNDDAQRYSRDGRYKELKYKSRETFVKIGIKAVNVRGTPHSWYKITHQGPDSTPMISQVADEEINTITKSNHGKARSQPLATS